MTACIFVSDLHGAAERLEALVAELHRDPPDAVFIGGDLLPPPITHAGREGDGDFLRDHLAPALRALASRLASRYPAVFAIPGNDDPRAAVPDFLALEREGLWSSMHMRTKPLRRFVVAGYACVPPTPFMLKDWERYDVSRHVDPGCVAPEEGCRSVPADPDDIRYGTIAEDLDTLVRAHARDHRLDDVIMLFHAPPYRTALDRADLDGRMFEGVPVDVNVGSIAIRRLIERRQPLVTLHGHVHESARLTGRWHDRIGRTHMLGAAHDGQELALVRFDPDDLERASRELV